MAVPFGRNTTSLMALRNLELSSRFLSSAQERLSSGLRINSASDDADALAVSMQLSAEAKVANQGVRNGKDTSSAPNVAGGAGMRNISDGTSLLSVAESGLMALKGTLIRQRELAQQALDGAITTKQRQALQQESEALSLEYDRIIESTTFNGRTLLIRESEQLAVYAGPEAKDTISIGFGAGLSRTVWTGTFTTQTTASTPVYLSSIADMNGDGNLDVVLSGNSIYYGNGDGTLQAPVSFTPNPNIRAAVADLNNDGRQDYIAIRTAGSTTAQIWLQNASGTFTNTQTVSLSTTGATRVITGDFNNDSATDFMVWDPTINSATVVYNSGSGTFGTQQALTTGNYPSTAVAQDLNGDGITDIALSNGGDTQLSISYGGQNALMSKPVLVSAGTGSPFRLVSADFNQDGIADLLASTNSNTGSLLLGTGAKGAYNYQAQSGMMPTEVADFNADGLPDVATNTSTSLLVNLGNGNGTFGTQIAAPIPTANHEVRLADFNNDGVPDVLSSNYASNFSISLANTKRISERFDISSQAAAQKALTNIARLEERVVATLDRVESHQSHLQTAQRVLLTTRDSYTEAMSRLMDGNVVEDASTLVRSKILQQVDISLLAQANLSPQLALTLLAPPDAPRKS